MTTRECDVPGDATTMGRRPGLPGDATRTGRLRGHAAGGLFLVAAILLGASRTARALCPNCLGQNATLSPTMRIVGVFLLIPPAVFFIVARIVRRLSR